MEIVTAEQGKIDKPLYAVFGKVTVPGLEGAVGSNGKILAEDGVIYVRSYALGNEKEKAQTSPSIPGPTFVFQPGDLLRLRFHNYLNRAADPNLNLIQNNTQQMGPPNFAASGDDTDEHVSHEISIPNDSNVTNLHVHGLHVDPKQDDVTLLVLPEDNDPGSLTPELQRFVPTINRWWTRNYQYKLPADHLPGTYWYHSHKHGSTSSQVENGMAGTLIIRPRDKTGDPVPDLWASGHDRVMMVQELANFATTSMLQNDRQGQGLRQGTPPVTTVNGQYQPVLKLPPGQVERWRFILAGANHTTSSYIWAGCIEPTFSSALLTELRNVTPKTTALTNQPSYTCISLPGKVKLIALDGITMWQSRDVTAQTPAFGSAGNRLDLLVQVDPAFTPDPTKIYRIYQNYPVPSMQDLAKVYPTLFSANDSASALRYALVKGAQSTFINSAGTTATPAAGNIPTDPFALGTNYQHKDNTVPWVSVDENGNPLLATGLNSYPVVPLLRGKKNSYNGVEIDDAIPQTFGEGETGWQALPDAGGGASVNANVLVTLDISGTPDGPTLFPKDFDGWLSANSPAGTGSSLQRVNPSSQILEQGIPDYVSPIKDEDIAGAQVAVFDRGQFTFSYVDKASQKQIDVRQFWINGRQFNVDDWIGNPKSPDLIKQPVGNVEPSLGVYSPSAAANAWTHQTNSGLLVTNPGYFKPIAKLNTTIPDPNDQTKTKFIAATGYNYDYKAGAKTPTYQDITGLEKPHTPVSTTAEEWLLVNNSDLFHPFHIHINPFFVTEIGQLNYVPKSEANKSPGIDSTNDAPAGWGLEKLVWKDGQVVDQNGSPSTNPFNWVVGNWWDVITIPPHGYVKFRMWVNVPSQSPVNHTDPDSDLVVHDNANIYGSWVFHCHILRHEDRGMMLMVNTQPKSISLGAGNGDVWVQDGNQISYKIADNHGGLGIQSAGATSPSNFIRGTFNRGIGNPMFSQPFLGSMTDTSASGPIAFCVANDPTKPDPNGRMLLSNGHFLSRNGTQGDKQVAATKLDLTGYWVDNNGRRARISQELIPPPPSSSTPSAGTPPPPPPPPQYKLTFTAANPVWWSQGTGFWNSSSYSGTGVLFQNQKEHEQKGQNQMLTFCISLDLNTLVFSNGITWTRAKP